MKDKEQFVKEEEEAECDRRWQTMTNFPLDGTKENRKLYFRAVADWQDSIVLLNCLKPGSGEEKASKQWASLKEREL